MNKDRNAQDYLGRGVEKIENGEYLGQVTAVTQMGVILNYGKGAIVNFSALEGTTIEGTTYSPIARLVPPKKVTEVTI